MSILPEPVEVAFDACSMSVALDDGRTITVPLAWYPVLLHATSEQRAAVWLSPAGLHWDALDEDISVEAMLGSRIVTMDARHAA